MSKKSLPKPTEAELALFARLVGAGTEHGPRNP